MAVEDKYTDTNLAAGKISNAYTGQGQNEITLIGTEETAAADSDGSVYRFFKSVPSNFIPVQIDIMTDGITSGTDFELGLYEVGVGEAAIDIDVLMGTQDLSSALTRATGQGLGLAAVDLANVGSTLGTLSGQSDVSASYDICLTANTVGSGVGTISIIAKFIEG